MPDRVSSRIAAAFAVVGLVAVLAVGAGLFVSLRTLHQEATISGLGDIAQPVLVRVRAVGALTELRAAAAALKAGLPDDIGLYAIVGGRVITAETGGEDAAIGGIDVTGLAIGQTTGGEVQAADGTRLVYAATVVRPAGPALGPVAIVLTTVDRSAGLALRDLVRVLPLVALVIVLVVAPIAWLVSRSITRPLRALAAATATVPAAGTTAEPLVPQGPREVRELTARFNAMTAELVRVRNEERELLANIRHDLRTPLTVVAGFAEALRDGTASGDHVARAADAIAQEAGRMGGLIEDLRAVDETGTSGVPLRPEALDPAALVADAVTRFAPRASAERVELRSDADQGLDLVADRAAVERILGNLVDNALAVVPAGGHVLVEARRGAGDSVAFRVSDDGPGFPPGSLERVFDRFYRADPARTGPGTGLGLSIVLALARAHGGTAVAENLAPTGGRVTVALPAIATEARLRS